MSQCRIISLSLILYIYYSKKKKTRKRNKNKKRRNAPWLRILLDLKEILDSIYYYIWRRKWQPTSVYCLENPMDRGVLQAPVHGVTRVRHDLATKERERQWAITLPVKIVLSKRQQIISAGENVAKREPSGIVGRYVSWCSHYGKQYQGSSWN